MYFIRRFRNSCSADRKYAVIDAQFERDHKYESEGEAYIEMMKFKEQSRNQGNITFSVLEGEPKTYRGISVRL